MTANVKKSDATWARVTSDILSPPVIWGVLAFPVAFRAAESVQQALVWALTYTALVCVMPAIYIGLNVWRGHISDIHIPIREQRIRPFVVSLIGTGIAWLVLSWMGAPALLPMFALFSLVQIGVMLLITIWWQISMHTMCITGAVVVTGALYGWLPMLLLTPLIPMVGAARLKLRRHTVAEVVAGFVVGGSITLVMTLISLPVLNAL
ncbi:MAG: phosphoesterase PA-phosphatase-like protein [Chloroflexi bacterium OLB15]|nr:MAG: phosphoesterase PA-phosphatase-like protein [Chloroflexi bacterium OLB15]